MEEERDEGGIGRREGDVEVKERRETQGVRNLRDTLCICREDKQ